LVEKAAENGLDLVAVRRVSGDELVVPSVVHWKQNHYAAIVERSGDSYLVKDPTFGRPLWMSLDTINAEASGNFLVSKDQISPVLRPISKAEAEAVFGKGLNQADPPPPPPPCPQDGQDGSGSQGGGCDSCSDSGSGADPGGEGGMPTWNVREPEISLLLHDRPMGYRTSIGEFALKLDYDQRETRPIKTNVFSLGEGWNCNLLSYMDASGGIGGYSSAILYGARGGSITYDHFGVPEYRTHTSAQLIRVFPSGDTVGLQQYYPDGSTAIYGLQFNVAASPPEDYVFMTERVDAHGRAIEQFIYNTNNDTVLLTAVVDFDGRTNSLYYGNTNFPTLVTKIVNPYTNEVLFTYDQNGNLTNVVDVASISSSFAYDYSNQAPIMTNLSTPYGVTTFAYTGPTNALYGTNTFDNINRSILVTAPDGGNSLFLYRDDSTYLYRSGNYVPFLPFCYCPNVPQGVPVVGEASGYSDFNKFYYTCSCNDTGHWDGICNDNVFYRDSFYWGPRQYALLSTTNITQLSTNDYKQGRLRNWLHLNLDAFPPPVAVSETINMERDPSPDGVTDGQQTWYGFTGRGTYNYRFFDNSSGSVTWNS
jgi:hypothetical protein